jgi:hypothetical protein
MPYLWYNLVKEKIMFTLSHLLGVLSGNAYRFDQFSFNSAMSKQGSYARRSGNLKGRTRSIYHNWGYNDSPYYVHLSKAERAGKTPEQTKAMRIKIWKKRSKKA